MALQNMAVKASNRRKLRNIVIALAEYRFNLVEICYLHGRIIQNQLVLI
jgi:hypothetical protein